MRCILSGVFIMVTMMLPVYAAQPVRGFVLDSTSGEPLPVANVVIEGKDRGATTNIDGFFALAALEPGNYTLHVSYLGYYSRHVTVTVTESEMDQLEIELDPTSMKLEGVTYTVEKNDDEAIRESPRVSTVPVDGTTLRAMPSLGAEMDVLRTIQAIPGVKASSEISSALYVRGASPDMTLILMDQSTVYNPSHLFGLFSTFNADAVKHIELIKGGFPAEYGGRAGSVLDVITNDGNRKEYEGTFMIGLISARASLEGPLPDNRGSFAGSFRRTYFEPVLDMMRNSSDDFKDLPDYFFYDGNAKINLDLSPSTTFTVGGYVGHDDFFGEFGSSDARLSVSSYWGNRTATARLRHVLSKSSFLTVGMAYSRYRSGAEIWDLDEADGDDNLLDDFRNRFNDVAVRADWEFMGWRNHRIKTGIQVNQLKAEVKEESEDLVWIDIDTTAYNVAYYLQDQWRINSMFEVQPGIRTYWHESGDYYGLDPRLALVYHHSPDMRFKMAGGRYHQFVNLISAGDLLSFYDIWLPYDGTVNTTVMNQYVLGWEYDFHPEYEFTVETYFNDMENLIEFNRSRIDEGETFDDVFLEGEGESYGVEFMLRKKTGRWTGWFGYSLSWSERRFANTYLNDGDWFPPKWDRRNDFIGIAMYRLTDHWDISGQWRFNTGQGYTQAVAATTFRNPEGNYNDGDYGMNSHWGSLNNYRHPADHRLDISADYNHKLFGMPAKLTFSIYNVYNRRSIYIRIQDTSTNPISYEDVKLLPILPLIGYEVRF